MAQHGEPLCDGQYPVGLQVESLQLLWHLHVHWLTSAFVWLRLSAGLPTEWATSVARHHAHHIEVFFMLFYLILLHFTLCHSIFVNFHLRQTVVCPAMLLSFVPQALTNHSG
jgi:hypothetical protein